MIKMIARRIKDAYRRIFHPIIFDLASEYSDELALQSEIRARNVLVGTVRRREQLAVNIEHSFYHIPFDEVGDTSGIEYVALYQSKALFSEERGETGIHIMAPVIKTAVVRRCEISEIPTSSTDERLYVRFDLGEWTRLERPVAVRETFPRVCLKTSRYLLSAALHTNELFAESAEEYVLALGISDLTSDLYDGFYLNGIKARRLFGRIYLKKGTKRASSRVKDARRKMRKELEKIIHEQQGK